MAEDKMAIQPVKLGFGNIRDLLYKKDHRTETAGTFSAHLQVQQLPGLLNGTVETPKNA